MCIVYKPDILPAITALSPEQGTLIHYLGGFFCVSLPGPWLPGLEELFLYKKFQEYP